MPPLYAAALVVLFESLCFTTQFPVISYYVRQLGGAGGWIGLMFLLVAGPKVLSNPLWGGLSDRVGRRPVLAINTLGTLVGSVLWALAPRLGGFASSLAWLALSRGIVGVFGGQAGLAQAIAADSSTPEKRAASMGVLGGAFALSLALGPLLGGLVAERWSHAAIGWLCAGLQVCSLVVIAVLLRETRQPRSDSAAATRVSTQDVAMRTADGFAWPVVQLLVITLVLTTGISGLNSTYGLLCEQQYGFSVRQTGYALAVLGLIAALVQGGCIRPLVRRMSERTVAVIGLVVLIWGLAILSKPPPEWGLWLGTTLYAVGIALATPCLTSMLTRATPADRQGRIAGVSQGVTGLGRAGGAGTGGWLYEHFGGARMPYAGAAATVFLALFLLMFVRTAARTDESAGGSEATPT